MKEGPGITTNLDTNSSEDLERNLRTQIGRMQEGDLREAVKLRTLDYRGNVKKLREQLLTAMLRDARAGAVNTNQEKTDVEHVEPLVNDKAEQESVARMKVVPKEEPTPPSEPESEEDRGRRIDEARANLEAKLADRDDALDRLAALMKEGQIDEAKTDPQAAKLLQEFKGEIERRTENLGREKKEIIATRRRSPEAKPFPDPKAIAKESVPSVTKVPESAKSAPTPIVLPERPRLLHKDELGRVKEAGEGTDRMEEIAQKLFRQEDPTPLEKDLMKEHPEIIARAGELLKNKNLEENIVNRPTSAPEEKETGPAKEPVLNGNVEFQLGKLGIIDSSDPQKFEANKKAVIDRIKTGIPNFFNLEPEQQLYTLKQLEKRAKRNITTDADAEVRAANAANKKGGWFGKQYRKIFEGSDAVKLEKTKAAELKQKGFDGYKEDFAQLTNFVETWGVKVKEGENGEPTLQFLEGKGKNDRHQGLIDTFNSRASALSNIPSNWMTEHATTYQKKRAEFAKKMYERSQKALLAYESKSKHFKKEEKAARSLEITNVASDVEMAQFLADNPGVESAVNKFIKEHPVLTKAAFIALGAGARGIAKYGSAFGGGLVASAALGGFTSWVRKRSEFREIEAQKRAGKDVGKVKGVKEGVNMVGYTQKINQLIERAKNTENPKKKAAILQSLQTRINILKDRAQNLGVVSFGSRSEDLNNQVEYFKAIKEANRLLIPASGIDQKVSDQVYKMFDQRYLKDAEKEAERKEAVRNAFTKGALIGGTGFVGGFIASDYLFHDSQAIKEAFEWTEETSRKAMGQVYMANEYLRGGFDPENVPMDNGSVRINPTTAGQPVNFPGNIPRPDSLPYDSTAMAPMSQTPVAESDFGTRGAIGAIKDLQRALINQYGGNMPENLKGFVDSNPDRLAIKWNMFRPQDMNESVAFPKGTKFLALPDGNIALRFPDGKLLGITNVTEHMQFDYFDSGARSAAPKIPDNLMDQGPATAGGDINNANIYNQGGVVGGPENAPLAGQQLDFERVKTGLEGLGFRHEAVPGGDIFSAEVSESAEPAGPQMVEGYRDIDGLEVDSKELKGKIDILYARDGSIKGIDLPALQVEDVSRFRAHPENFIGGSHDASEKAMLGKKLTTMGSQVETFLKYRRIMEVQSLHPDSPEYKFLHEESNKLWSAIQKKVDYQFNPEYQGFQSSSIKNTASMVEVPKEQMINSLDNSSAPSSNERPPFVRNLGEDNVATEADLEHEKDLAEAHRLEVEKGAAFEIEGNKTYAKAIEKYGEVSEIKGNIIIFEKGYVGFYGESMDEATALKKGEALARANSSIVDTQQDHIGIKQNGVNRIMYIFKKR